MALSVLTAALYTSSMASGLFLPLTHHSLLQILAVTTASVFIVGRSVALKKLLTLPTKSKNDVGRSNILSDKVKHLKIGHNTSYPTIVEY